MKTEQTNIHKTVNVSVDLTDVVKWVGLALLWLTGLIAAWWLTGRAGVEVTRWWAALATMLLPVAVGATAWIATLSAREHLAGLERGMDASQRAVEGMGRSLGAAVQAARVRNLGGDGSVAQSQNPMLIEMRDDDLD